MRGCGDQYPVGKMDSPPGCTALEIVMFLDKTIATLGCMTDLPHHVLVYGGDHSPWVQTVLLGIAERNIPYTIITAPPFNVFNRWGVLMPAARIDGQSWMLQSEAILCELGFEQIGRDDKRAIIRSARGGVHRIDSARRFWREWSLVRDGAPGFLSRSKHSFFRAFSVLYFHLALSQLSRDPRSRTDTKGYERQFLYWEEQLTQIEGAFIDGEKPGTRDFMLFGVLQCHASIEVPPVAVLQTSQALPMLRGWIAAMQNRYPEYHHLYSGTYFEPARSKPEEASVIEQVAFWLGSVVVLLAFPLTVPLALHYQKKVRREKLI